MTVVNQSLAALDRALNDPTNTLLLLFDSADDLAQKIHDRADGQAGFVERRTFLIRDRAALRPDLRAIWPAADDEFVIWSCFTNAGFIDKLDSLLLSDGKNPSILLIKKAFIEGEEL